VDAEWLIICARRASDRSSLPDSPRASPIPMTRGFFWSGGDPARSAMDRHHNVRDLATVAADGCGIDVYAGRAYRRGRNTMKLRNCD